MKSTSILIDVKDGNGTKRIELQCVCFEKKMSLDDVDREIQSLINCRPAGDNEMEALRCTEQDLHLSFPLFFLATPIPMYGLAGMDISVMKDEDFQYIDEREGSTVFYLREDDQEPNGEIDSFVIEKTEIPSEVFTEGCWFAIIAK